MMSLEHLAGPESKKVWEKKKSWGMLNAAKGIQELTKSTLLVGKAGTI